MQPARTDLVQGTLDLLILKVLTLGPLHGWGVLKRIEQLSREALRVNQGSLYPALYRLEDRGWVRSRTGESPEGRAVKFYELTAAGRRQLAREVESWRRFSAAVAHVLRTAELGA
jgi:PadR family transcriptional regulator PadR